MAQIILDRLMDNFRAGEILETGSQHGNEWARIRPDAWSAVARFLRDDPVTLLDMFVDLTVVDRFSREPRFDVVLSYDLGNGVRIEKGGDIVTKWPAYKENPELPRAPRAARRALLRAAP